MKEKSGLVNEPWPIIRSLSPVLLTVRGSVEEAPLATLAKASVAGVADNAGGDVPIPVSTSFWALGTALELSVSVPLIDPRRVGVKRTEISQVAPTASVAPQLLVTGKSAGSSSVMLLMVSGPLPVLLTVTVCAEDASPIVTLPKSVKVPGVKLALGCPLPNTVKVACGGNDGAPAFGINGTLRSA